MDGDILRIEHLVAEFNTPDGVVRAVNDVSLTLKRGATLAVTGESGSGKSTLALAILNLLPHPGHIVGGAIYLDGNDLLKTDDETMRSIRGRDIAMVFQDPATGLNPVLSVGQQVEETITTHLDVSKQEARSRTIDVLRQIGLPEPDEIVKRYPFQLSGGMAQRVMIAIATALNPRVLILDEPTSALDVTVQAAILEDLTQLQALSGTSIILIAHDLGIVAQMAQDVAVMYAGTIVEEADAAALYERPRHPYTWSLLASRPRWDRESSEPLPAIRGAPPNLIDLPDQCAFVPRCPKAISACREGSKPLLDDVEAGHAVACYNPMYQAGAE